MLTTHKRTSLLPNVPPEFSNPLFPLHFNHRKAAARRVLFRTAPRRNGFYFSTLCLCTGVDDMTKRINK